MAKFQFSGLDDYISGMAKIHSNVTPCIKKAVYSGAKVVADAIHDEINALPENPENYHATQDRMTSGVSKRQKEGLIEGLGVSSMSDDAGFVNVKIGFAGYNAIKTKAYPKGQPNALIARSVISGTSFRQKNPFVSRALKKVKAQAEAAMTSAFDAEFEKNSN